MEQDTINGNKLIAGFMGAEETKPIGYTKRSIRFPKITHGLVVHHEYELLYHTSWDWLMPVVEKIFSLSEQQKENDKYVTEYYFRTFGMKDTEGNWMVRINGFGLHSDLSLIKATYSACLEFIQWYNAKQQK